MSLTPGRAKLWRGCGKRNRRLGFSAPIALVFAALLVFAARPADADDANFKALFERHDARGTLFIVRSGDGTAMVHDIERAKRPFIPASTFKIPHTLIALDTGVVRSAEQVFEWDGARRSIAAWNRDLSLREAFRVSAVPIFQRIAREIGPKRMNQALAKIGYGNERIGAAIDMFWLTGPLMISAEEQVAFVEQVADGSLPFTVEHQATLRSIMIDGRGDGWTLHGKTGWTRTPDPDIGWYVGWLETTKERYVFALNIDMTRKSHRRARRQIVVEALRAITGLPIQ